MHTHLLKEYPSLSAANKRRERSDTTGNRISTLLALCLTSRDMETPEPQALALVLLAVLLFHIIIAALAVIVPGPIVKGYEPVEASVLVNAVYLTSSFPIFHATKPHFHQVCMR